MIEFFQDVELTCKFLFVKALRATQRAHIDNLTGNLLLTLPMNCNMNGAMAAYTKPALLDLIPMANDLEL